MVKPDTWVTLLTPQLAVRTTVRPQAEVSEPFQIQRCTYLYVYTYRVFGCLHTPGRLESSAFRVRASCSASYSAGVLP
jgi:hypothetical protein